MPRKEHKTTPKVVWQTLSTDSAAVPVESPLWFDWLAHNAMFEQESPDGTFTARRELRNGVTFWYAFRRHRNKLYKAYLGRTADLTHARLLAVAQQLTEKAGAWAAHPALLAGRAAQQRQGQGAILRCGKSGPTEPLYARPAALPRAWWTLLVRERGTATQDAVDAGCGSYPMMRSPLPGCACYHATEGSSRAAGRASTAGPKKHDSFCQLPTADYKRLRSRQLAVGSHTNCDVISAALH